MCIRDRSLISIDDLELTLNIIKPQRVSIQKNNNPEIELSKNLIKWNLIPGEINSLEFSFWNWNKILLGSFLILFIMLTAYFVRFYRYQIGPNFPELPSN